MHQIISSRLPFLIAAIGWTAFSTAQTRVACLGDSITFGAQVVDREHNAYPTLLDALLGERFVVRNFGVGGAARRRSQ
jgi:lysophospholipase L1-like esterase